MKKILFALAMCLLMVPAFAQHHDNHHDDHHNHHNERRDDNRPRPVPVRIATPEEVSIIFNYVKGISFDKDKAEAIKVCMQLTPMRAEDIANLVGLISFDDEQVKVMKFCYPLCPNKDRYPMVIERLTFDSNKNDMYKFIATH